MSWSSHLRFKCHSLCSNSLITGGERSLKPALEWIFMLWCLVVEAGFDAGNEFWFMMLRWYDRTVMCLSSCVTGIHSTLGWLWWRQLLYPQLKPEEPRRFCFPGMILQCCLTLGRAHSTRCTVGVYQWWKYIYNFTILTYLYFTWVFSFSCYFILFLHYRLFERQILYFSLNY